MIKPFLIAAALAMTPLTACQSITPAKTLQIAKSGVVMAQLSKVEGLESYGDIKIEVEDNIGNAGIIWVVEDVGNSLTIIDTERRTVTMLCYTHTDESGIRWYGPCPVAA